MRNRILFDLFPPRALPSPSQAYHGEMPPAGAGQKAGARANLHVHPLVAPVAPKNLFSGGVLASNCAIVSRLDGGQTFPMGAHFPTEIAL